MRPRKSREVVIAELKINRPGKMTPTGRRQVAAWLRRQAALLIAVGHSYADDAYRARYLFTPPVKKGS
jgi:hypothetical protein